MAPKLMKMQVNSDKNKETLYNKSISYGPKTLAGMSTLVRKQEINLTGLDSLDASEISRISKELNLKISSKSNKMLLEEIKHVARTFLAGQGKHIY